MTHTREKVNFDPSNKNHRKVYHEFVKNNNKWGNTNIFILELEYTNIISMIQDKLLRYYTGKEFK